MKLWTIFRFEFIYQLGRPWPWLFVAVLLVLSFLMTRDGSLSDVLYADFFLNSPFSVVKTTVFGSLIWLVMAAAIAGDAAARDVATGMYPFTYTAPLSKAQYLGGRFFAALILNAFILLAVQAGILLGVYLPGVDAALVGPFRPAAFLTAYAFISVPNAFAATAVQFSLATQNGRAMAGYFGSFLLLFMGFFVASFLLYSRSAGALLDPIGIRFIVEDIAHLWTTVEKNWRLLRLEGIVLQNRLLWFGIAVETLAVTYFSFRFSHRIASSWWMGKMPPFRLLTKGTRGVKSSDAYDTQRQNSGPSGSSGRLSKPISIPQAARTFGFATHIHQMLTTTWRSFRTIATSWAGLALLVAIPLLTIPIVLDQMESRGISLIPKTIYVISELTGAMSNELSRWVIIPFLIVFFAGELVWRERDAGLGELTDTMPGSDWPLFLGKFLGLALLLVLFLALQSGAGMLAQQILGYQDFELKLYLKIMFGLQLTEYLLFALLAIVVHIVVNQKYIGHLVAIIAFVFIAMTSLFGIEHKLLIWGAAPNWSYTDMRSFGPSLGPWLWFKLYWMAWALLLAVVARVLWVRGRESSLRLRLQLASGRFSGLTAWAGAMAVGLIFLLGGFIFYNTNVLNEYLTASEIKKRQAEYELRYGKYADIPQPLRTAVRLQVEIYPEQRTVDIHGTYKLVNRSAVAIDSIHLATAQGVETGALTFHRPATLVLADEKLYHRIYALEKPLQPGDSLQIHFQLQVKPRGFREGGVVPAVAKNGTYFTNSWLPAIGYERSRELISVSDRREHGLHPRPLIASLYGEEARKKRGEGITVETVVSTDKSQVAVAPGALRKTWTEGDRAYFHYVSDGPIGGEWGFFSADYAVHEGSWTGSTDSGQVVEIRIFHQPENTVHLDRMLYGIRASLDYYSKQFGPYEYNHISFVERPGKGTGMHADASMITYAEGFAHWQPKEDGRTPDIPFAVVAHEMAHQWTVPYANVEGAPVLSESLAWYYAMKVVEKAKGPGHFRRFLGWMRQPYRREIRRGEPLLRGLDPYMSYRKGPFALYTLSRYVGEKTVNRALRRLLEKHRPKEAPLATTLDLYSELQKVTPDSLQYLLHDLFEVNTNWDLEVENATARQIAEGTWQLTLALQARKLVFDSAGVETEVPMNDWIEVGVFSAGEGAEPKEPLYLQKHLIRSGRQTIKLTVPEMPESAGIDPHYLLIDSKPEDNIEEVNKDQTSPMEEPSSQGAPQKNKEVTL